MSNVIDLNKFKSIKEQQQSLNGGEPVSKKETEGNYLSILVGESKEEEIVILVEQVEVVGTTTHSEKLVLTVDMLHSLIEELISAADVIEGME
tara:strand:- start:1781 stop:2059 length:279 start_codon:yes stop_codon:yes gene_type:complete